MVARVHGPSTIQKNWYLEVNANLAVRYFPETPLVTKLVRDWALSQSCISMWPSSLQRAI